MALKIRLARVGRKKQPLYRIVAINGQSKRDGAALEVLGTYNPLKDQFVQLHQERIAFWTHHGAIQSDSVKRLLRSYARRPQPQMAATPEVAPAETTAVAEAQQ